MKRETIIAKAAFNEKTCAYWLTSVAFIFAMTFVGIPLLLLWIPLGMIMTKRYLASMECILTDNALKVKKGILVRVEKTIPLEKITDVGMIQGPLMRQFGLHMLTFETAGQSGLGALVSMTGIVDPEAFRETVLERRDRIHQSATTPPSTSSGREASATEDATAILRDIRASLARIETLLTTASNQKSDAIGKG